MQRRGVALVTLVILSACGVILSHPTSPPTIGGNNGAPATSPPPPSTTTRRYSNESLELLRGLNISTLILASRDARMGGVLLAYLKEQRNKTLERRQRRRHRNNGTTMDADNGTDRTELLAYALEDEEYGDEYDEEYPDFDFSPASILIYVLELFGTLIGLAWGAFGTFFGAG